MQFVLVGAPAAAQDPPVDWERARALNQRARQGESLSKGDRAYLERARRLRAAAARGDASQTQPTQAASHFTPLTELTTVGYQGEDGGLYGSNRNDPPSEHQASARRETEKITALDREGKRSENGQIVLLSLGMSNTTQEFSEFKRIADNDAEKAPALVIVDGAQGGQDAVRTADASVPFWLNIDERLKNAGVTGRQVQIVWIKQAIAGPRQGFPAEAKRLQELLVKTVHIAKERFPNLRVAYLSSRIYAGYATTRLNPEPYAYESAFAVRWLIQDQMRGNLDLNFDSGRGPIKAPVLLWGPYLWADGQTPRQSDGLVWKPEDFGGDGTHPSLSGRRKVAEQILKFFKTDPTARSWFVSRP